MILLSGHGLKIGHFAQPDTRATGHSVILVLLGLARINLTSGDECLREYYARFSFAVRAIDKPFTPFLADSSLFVNALLRVLANFAPCCAESIPKIFIT